MTTEKLCVTPEHEAKMVEVRDRWIKFYNSCKQITKDEEAAVIADVQWVYELAELTKPEVVIVDSPKAAQEAGNKFLKNTEPVYLYSGWRMSGWDCAWTAYYEFFEEIGVKYDCPHWERWKAMVKRGIYSSIQLDGFCAVSRMPLYIKTDGPDFKLHNLTGPAMEFADGYSVYALWNVLFDKELFEYLTSGNVDPKRVLALENIEQRMVALKMLGTKAILDNFPNKVMDKKEGYTLYEITGMTSKTNYVLQYFCPSTNKEYLSFVRPEVGEKGDAIEAIASKWNLNKEQWYQIGSHS
jgi:hypothetical protein